MYKIVQNHVVSSFLLFVECRNIHVVPIPCPVPGSSSMSDGSAEREFEVGAGATPASMGFQYGFR